MSAPVRFRCYNGCWEGGGGLLDLFTVYRLGPAPSAVVCVGPSLAALGVGDAVGTCSLASCLALPPKSSRCDEKAIV